MGTHRTPLKSECANSSRSYGENGVKKSGNFGLDDFCLYGCFSGAQYVVFAGKSANEGRQLSRDRSHTAGSLRLPKPDLWLGPGNFAQPRREGPTGMAERGTQPSSLTTTSGGLLKQPYKQKSANVLSSVYRNLKANGRPSHQGIGVEL
jgi:hypothetical protein